VTQADHRTLAVPEGLDGERVDAALARLFGVSRTRAAELVAEGNVLLDGSTVAKSHRVEPGALLEVSFPVRLGDLFDYPYREVWPTLEAMLRHVGSRNLLWGTDMPFQNRFCTYRQSRRWIETCGLLSSTELDDVMGGSTARLLGIAPAVAA